MIVLDVREYETYVYMICPVRIGHISHMDMIVPVRIGHI